MSRHPNVSHPWLKTQQSRRQFVLALWESDGKRCIYCRRRTKKNRITIDHYIPRSKRGSSNRNNLVHACLDCNREKANMMPLQFILSRVLIQFREIA